MPLYYFSELGVRYLLFQRLTSRTMDIEVRLSLTHVVRTSSEAGTMDSIEMYTINKFSIALNFSRLDILLQGPVILLRAMK